MRGEHVERPGLQPAEDLRHGAIKGLDFRGPAEPLAVGRIADDAAVLPFAVQIGERALLEVDLLGHAGLLGMMAGQLQGRVVDVRAEDAQGQIGQDRLPRRPGGPVPTRPPEWPARPRPRTSAASPAPWCGRSSPPRSGSCPCRKTDRPAADPASRSSTGPARRPASPSAAPCRPGGGSRACAARRRWCRWSASPGSPAARPRWNTWGPSPEPLDPVGRLEALDDRLLDDLLARRHAGKLRLDRTAADGELAVGRDPLVPRQGPGAIEELAEIRGLEAVQPQQHAVGGAEPQVRPADGRRLAVKQDPARLDESSARSRVLRARARRPPPARRSRWQSGPFAQLMHENPETAPELHAMNNPGYGLMEWVVC